MIPELRTTFNAEFTPERYAEFEFELYAAKRHPVDFRVAETPVFLSSDFFGLLLRASQEILAQLRAPSYRKRSREAVPEEFRLPVETDHPLFLRLDFAICDRPGGSPVPLLTGLQGVSPLYCFMVFFDEMWRKHFTIGDNLTAFYGGLRSASYLPAVRNAIIGGCNPEQVILLDVEPERQKHRIDYACAEEYLGIPVVNLADLIVRGKNIFYLNDDIEVPVKRIYNRVSPDDLMKRKTNPAFDFRQEYNATWAGHPEWFYRMSDFALPFIDSEFSPQAWFLDELDEYPSELKQCVLQPLFFNADPGFGPNLSARLLDSLRSKKGFLLRKKPGEGTLIDSPAGPSKAEISVLYLWVDEPAPVANLVRLTRQGKTGPRHNIETIRTETSIAYHPC